jgi:peptidoglycan hydrolase-like protein with peptidoglycan-binding domain
MKKKIAISIIVSIAWGLIVFYVGNTVFADTVVVVPPAPVDACSSINQDLSLGSRVAVRELQIALNKDPSTEVAVSGPGSPGNETIYFGPATYQAVLRFQLKYRADILDPAGLAHPTGFVGTLTRAKILSLCGSVIQSNAPVISGISPSAGPVGTVVTLAGSGFGATGNTVILDGGTAANNISSNGTSLAFTIPSFLTAQCTTPGMACPMYARELTAGTYQISVVNSSNVSSNQVTFTVTGSGVTVYPQ